MPGIVSTGGGDDWVVFDLETTGLSPDWDTIIQIAAVRMRGGRRMERESFELFVNPGRPIPAFITQYTGIGDRHVRGAPGIVTALQEFSHFVGESTLVAHNGHRFDMKFLAAECRKSGLPTRPVEYHDSLGLSWALWGRKGCRHGLDSVLQRLDLADEAVRRHDARGDVLLLARAIEAMTVRLKDSGQPLDLRRYEGSLPRID